MPERCEGDLTDRVSVVPRNNDVTIALLPQYRTAFVKSRDLVLCVFWERSETIPPDFFAEKFSAAMDKIQFRDAMSLDEAFGWVKPSPKKFNADKKRKDLRLPVYAACIEASKKGMPLKKNSNKKSAFDYTAEKFDISPGQAEKYYGEWNKVFRDLEAHEIKDLKK